jgi:YD repeat-containing protein
MKNRLLLLLSASLWLACQTGDSSEFGIEPGGNTYNDEASPSKKLFCNSGNCDNPMNIEQYTYNSAGKLTRIEFLNRNISGKLEIYSYVENRYNQSGQLVGKARFGKYSSDIAWVAYDESEYEYVGGVLKTERNYFNQRNPEKRVMTSQVEYEFKEGKKVGQKWFDANNQLSYRVVYDYKDNVLTRETWYSNTDKIIRLFTHSFAGNRRQISEHMPNSDEQIALIEKTYDKQGRLFSEETKVNNPLLCSMVAGTIRYTY